VLLPESRREKVNGFSRMRAFSLKDIYQIRIGVDAVELYSNKQTLNDSYVFCSDLTPTGGSPAEEPVLSPHGYRTKSPLKVNCIKREFWVLKEDSQRSLTLLRFIDSVPHGHWKTSTFAAGLRHNGIIAPAVFDGAMDGDYFRAYIAQIMSHFTKSSTFKTSLRQQERGFSIFLLTVPTSIRLSRSTPSSSNSFAQLQKEPSRNCGTQLAVSSI
jgi:hypothetical protein